MEVQPTEPSVDIRWPRQGVAQVILGGEHDLSSVDRLSTALAETLHDCSRIVVDLRDTKFIDCSTIGALVDAKASADAAGRGFNVVLATTPGVERTLQISGVLAILNRVHTLEQALGQG